MNIFTSSAITKESTQIKIDTFLQRFSKDNKIVLPCGTYNVLETHNNYDKCSMSIYNKYPIFDFLLSKEIELGNNKKVAKFLLKFTGDIDEYFKLALQRFEDAIVEINEYRGYHLVNGKIKPYKEGYQDRLICFNESYLDHVINTKLKGISLEGLYPEFEEEIKRINIT